jgi:rhodanese-related sulfurtransferase
MASLVEYFEQKLAYEIDSSDLAEFFLKNRNGTKIIVIDTRSLDLYNKEHIPGAINVPHRNMNIEATKSWDRNAVYVSYCNGIGCNGSTKGAFKLASLGFNVKELIGGLDWWKRDGFSTEGSEGVARKISVSCAC